MSEADRRKTAGSELLRAHARLRADLAAVQNGTSGSFTVQCLAGCGVRAVFYAARGRVVKNCPRWCGVRANLNRIAERVVENCPH
jgi:hypothetical protein